MSTGVFKLESVAKGATEKFSEKIKDKIKLNKVQFYSIDSHRFI